MGRSEYNYDEIKMKDSKSDILELEKVRQETERKAETFYKEYNIFPEHKNNSLLAPQDEEVLFTVFSNKTSNLF